LLRAAPAGPAALLLAIVMALSPSAALAWGFLPDIDAPEGEQMRESYLPYAVITQGAVTICLRNDRPDRFNDQSIKMQVEAVLGLWLDAAGESASVKWDACTDTDVDLVVNIVDVDEPFIAYASFEDVGNRTLSSITFNTAFEGEPPERAVSEDFVSLLPAGSQFPEVFKRITGAPTTIGHFAAINNLSYMQVFLSSLPTLLHEMGHAFGLCDLYGEEIEYCDKDHLTPVVGSSMMLDTNGDSFNLAQDDIDGIRAVFKFYRDKIDAGRKLLGPR
jgi:hypothetical protein